MQLERVAATLRPRKPFEAFDLGLAMLQAWSGPIAAAWLFTAVPACVLALAAIDSLPLALLALWFLRPVFELVPVLVASRALFGGAPGLQGVLAALPGALARQGVRALFVHRWLPWRALVQPVGLLEGERGSRRSRRERDVVAGGRAHGTLASVTSLLLEIALWVQLVAFVYFLTPEELAPELSALSPVSDRAGGLGWFGVVVRASWLVSYSVFGPLHSLCGFALYLNRRTLLEGWDIEIVFRSLAARAARMLRRVAPVLVAALLALAGPVPGSPVLQDAVPRADEQRRDPVEVATEVLAHEDFETHETRRRLKFDFDARPKDPLSLDLGLLASLLQALGWALLVALLFGLAFLIARTFGWVEWSRARTAAVAAPPTHVFGLDVRPQSLPQDIGARARELWLAGDASGAMGLLYRGALSRLITRHGLAFEPGDTERDCLERVRGLGTAPRGEFFARVTRAWQVCAYSRQRPGDEEALALCDGWSGQFEGESA